MSFSVYLPAEATFFLYLVLMTWTDSHCHLEGFRNNGNLPEVLRRAREAGVSRLVAIGTDPEDWAVNRELAAEFPGEVFHTVGLHPNYVEDGWMEQVAGLRGLFDETPRPAAVGEIGLDYFRLPQKEAKAAPRKEAQKAAFRDQLALAKELNAPVAVHCRSAFADCVAEIDASGVAWEKIVFHCFADGPEEMDVLKKRGGRASFTGIVTFGNAEKVQAAAKLQGLDKLMVETDSPYLAPEPVRGQPNEPAYLPHVGVFLARLLEMDVAALAAATTRNAADFYGLPSA